MPRSVIKRSARTVQFHRRAEIFATSVRLIRYHQHPRG